MLCGVENKSEFHFTHTVNVIGTQLFYASSLYVKICGTIFPYELNIERGEHDD